MLNTEGPVLKDDDAALSGSGFDDDAPMTPEEQRRADLERVQRLGEALTEKRKRAIEYRQQVGVEQDWQEDEEFYQSIDRANPEGETHVGRPISASGGPLTSTNRVLENRSSVFIPITRAYVDAASARVSDMLLPNDDRPWSIKATPVQQQNTMLAGTKPTAIAAAAGAVAGGPIPEGAVYQPGQEVPAFEPSIAAAIGMPADQAPAPYSIPQMKQPLGISDSAMSDEEKAADAASKVIEDWLIECQWHAEVRKVIEDAAKFGTGILKGPVSMVRKSHRYVKNADGIGGKLEEITETVPVSKRVHPKNFWPDPAAGECVQNGSFTFEHDKIGSRSLRKLAQDPTYIKENIVQVLKEGPGKSWSDNPEGAEARVEVGATFGIWYCYIDLDRELLECAGVPPEDLPDELTSIPAMVTMVNDTVIKAAPSLTERGGFPYDVMPWQRLSGLIWGKGVARQIRTPQRMLNGAVRAMMDNAAWTSGPLVALRESWFKPVGGPTRGGVQINPRTLFRMTENAPTTAKIQDAISSTNITSNIAELQQLVQLALKFAEDSTGLPMLLQGQQGAAPDTVGGMTILNNNGSTVLRRIARMFDDNITEPHIRRYYYWLLEDPDAPEEAKGDFQIDARGSTALVERDLQNQALNNLAPLLMNHPRVDKDKLVEELAKANRLDPKRFMLSDAEYEKIKNQPPPPPESVMVAQMREKGATERKAMELAYKEKHDSTAFKLEEGKLKATYEQGLAQIAKDMNISADTLKTRLAELSMKLTTQVQLADASRMANAAESDRGRDYDAKEGDKSRVHEMTKAAVEPAGRAPAGQAFEA